jgi:hypothetical protein
MSKEATAPSVPLSRIATDPSPFLMNPARLVI